MANFSKSNKDNQSAKTVFDVPAALPEMVSKTSYWKDFNWDFDSPTAGQSLRLRWQFIVPGGDFSTDGRFSILLQSFQVVCWGMFNRIGWYGKTLQVGSTPTFSVGMRELFRWCVLRGYSDFGQLTPEVQDQFLDELPTMLIDKRRFYLGDLDADFDEDEVSDINKRWGIFDTRRKVKVSSTPTGRAVFREQELPESVSSTKSFHKGAYIDTDVHADDTDSETDEEDKFTYGQVATRINLFYFIYGQSDLLRSAGLVGMAAPPFRGATAGEVAQQVATYTLNRIPPLPDEVAGPLLKEAIDWVETKAYDVLQLQETYLLNRTSYETHNRSTRRALSDCFAQIEFSALPGENKPWREPLVPEMALHPEHGPVSRDAIQVLRDLILTARAAFLLLLQYLVGMRTNEICSIVCGGDTWGDERFPSCIKTRFSKDGSIEMFFVEATLSKGRKKPMQELWLLGARPVGTTYVPLPVQAISQAYVLLKPWRLLGQSDDLFVSFSNPKGLPQISSSVGRVLNSSVLRYTKKFVFTEVDLTSLPDWSARGEDLTAYRDSKGTCIRTHQGRKTFAAYVLESRSSYLKAVSQHFKHSSTLITSDAYFPVAVRLRDEIDTVQEAETIAFFSDAINGMPVYGHLAEAIGKMRADENWNISDLGIRESRVRDFIIMHDLRIIFSDHGNCLIKLNPLESRCRAATGGTGWNLDSPAYSARNPNLCAGCGCFLFDASHYPYWKDREGALLRTLEQAGTAGNRHEFYAMEKRYSVAKNVVKFLERRKDGN